ncbi:hypothetical protein VNO77_30648 [Canavalia gladiata]|uniref:Uncharacterized protein n=1 Tax=Canavalia gladiata TaxID=3824 RepID=A0AAN9KNM4_CANGL
MDRAYDLVRNNPHHDRWIGWKTLWKDFLVLNVDGSPWACKVSLLWTDHAAHKDPHRKRLESKARPFL